MSTETMIKKQNIALETILKELRTIRNQLKRLLLLIPEESLKEYKNSSQIKKAYLKATKVFPPK